MMAAGVGLCGMCCRPISDRFLLRIMDVSYHEQCVQCCACGDRLHHTCFVRDSKLYCRIDYDRLFIKKCLGCSERVSPEELVMRASDNIFHLRCFICVVCGIRLQKGDLYVIKQGQLFCRIDYEKEVEMMQGFGYDLVAGEFICDDLIPSSRSHDGRRGPKRPRTILTTQQRRAFKASFEVSPKPCRKVREALAKDTGLSVRIVQVWFQNQRAKMKKMQKKARQDNKGGKDVDGDEKKLSVKEEEPSPHSTPFFNDSCSDNETTTGEDTTLQGQETSHFSRIKEEIENENYFYKTNNNIPLHSFQGLDLKRRDDHFVGLPFPNSVDSSPSSIFLQPPVAHQNPPHSQPGLNPIDRLYSMQNSYFCGEDSVEP
ncbi:LIM homeobox transcription factor 1-beta [Rhynchophorus ferrugineus]|uniref:LIM homeobox transcription factor 1-beta n=1 Tax=Rhynchophorus ferrugineus TaxID=354439 RepID=UPI003FCCBA1F